MRAAGALVTTVLGLAGAAGATSSNDEARVAAIAAIVVAIVTGVSTIIGQIVSARTNRRDEPNNELRDLALLILLDSHADDPEVKAEAGELAKHVRSRMREVHRERYHGAAETSRPVAAPRPPRRGRRPVDRRPEGRDGDGESDS